MKDIIINIKMSEEELNAWSLVEDMLNHILQEEKRHKIRRVCKKILKYSEIIMDASAIYSSDDICENGRIDIILPYEPEKEKKKK